MIQKVISGSKGGSQKPHNPVEMEDNLISINKIKILLAVSDGEIDETFSLKQLMFNSVPVQNEDGSFNFEGVKAEFSRVRRLRNISREWKIALVR
ncbi:tail protein and host specificity [Escherichia phage ADB-2]|uniref:Uncharacterized protein n=1 Tax=Escherichia phage ADB-2 TaxID=1216926 RepID=K4NZ73_9CAUD|nr:tail protein and host specificity [Escherichia phage ADB-2]AFV50951.1 hypothetical protein B508_00280 [Escherichia phage ADB-2]